MCIEIASSFGACSCWPGRRRSTAAVPARRGAAAKVIVVPPGNRSAKQPPISAARSSAPPRRDGTFDDKYQAGLRAPRQRPGLIAKIKQVAAPTASTRSTSSAPSSASTPTTSTSSTGCRPTTSRRCHIAQHRRCTSPTTARPLEHFCAAAAIRPVRRQDDNYELWDCRETVWNTKFQGQDGRRQALPDDRFDRVFFQPFFAGQTFGLGQLSPVAALMVTDVVHGQAGLPLLDIDDAPAGLQAVMDPDMSLNYMAAIIRDRDRRSIATIAGFDISRQPRHHRDALQYRRRGRAPGSSPRRTASAAPRASRQSIRTRITTAGWSTTSWTSCEAALTGQLSDRQRSPAGCARRARRRRRGRRRPRRSRRRTAEGRRAEPHRHHPAEHPAARVDRPVSPRPRPCR